MKHNSFITRAVFIVATVLLTVLVTATKSFAQDRVDKVSAKGFDATVKAIEKTLKSKGFMIVATVDH